MARKKHEYYVSNAELLEEYRKYYATGVVSENMGRLIMLVINRIGTHRSFNGYSYIDEMKANARLHLIRKLDKFNIDKYSNVLAYWTAIVWNSFRATLNSEKKERNIRDALKEQAELNPSFAYEDRDKQLVYSERECDIMHGKVTVTKYGD